MCDDNKDNLQDLWRSEIAVRKQAQRWTTLSNAGFIGLVGTELPEFFAKNKGCHPSWRVPLFVASSVSIVAGVMMSWIKGGKAEAMRESILMIEHGKPKDADAKTWNEKIAAQPGATPSVSR